MYDEFYTFFALYFAVSKKVHIFAALNMTESEHYLLRID